MFSPGKAGNRCRSSEEVDPGSIPRFELFVHDHTHLHSRASGHNPGLAYHDLAYLDQAYLGQAYLGQAYLDPAWLDRRMVYAVERFPRQDEHQD